MNTRAGVRFRRCVLGGVILALAAPAAPAATTRTWSTSTAEELQRGTLEGTAIDDQGHVRLAPDVTTVWGPERGIVWDLCPAGPGAAHVALSGPGRVLRVATGGDPGRVETWYEPGGEALITALAEDGAGGAYAGVSPSGDVVHLERAGESTTVLAAGAKFVWGLARGPDGSLWIGTGLPGRVLRRLPGGEVRVIFESGDDPVRSIVALAGGGAVFGTGGRGRVVRVGEDGRPFVLFDADEPEVVALARGGSGEVFALTAAGTRQVQGRASAAPAVPDAVVRVVVTASGEPSPSEPEGGAPPPEREPERAEQRLSAPSGGALYRIAPDGASRKIWSTAAEAPFDLALLGDGRLVVATGDAGALHAVDAEGRSARWMRLASDQASALAVGPAGELWAGGTGDARVDLVGRDPRAAGAYVSVPIDAGHLADWGRLRWSADVPRGSKLGLRVRRGNSAEPDSTWSAWDVLEGAAGESAAPIGGAPARWLQLALDLDRGRGASPAVRALEVTYTPRNRPPAVSQLTVESPGVVWVLAPTQSSTFSGPFVADDPVARGALERIQSKTRSTAPPAVRKAFEQGARTFVWSADDPDGDRLRYAVEVRREGAESWLPLASDLADAFHSWDARSLPDGEWRARVRADDARDNAEGEALRAERVSEIFRIDNTRPAVEGFDVVGADARREARFVAHDPGGAVAACEVALDGGPWRALDPDDGVADAEREPYRLSLGGAALPRAVRVRVIDAAGNVGGDVWLIEEPR